MAKSGTKPGTKSGFIQGVGIYYQGELRTIKKNRSSFLYPVYEAFTNALEAIKAYSQRTDDDSKGAITLNICLTPTLYATEEKVYSFNKLEISDTGIGFEDTEYHRFLTLRDNRKGNFNKGTGRIQFLHSFDQTIYESSYQDSTSSTGYKFRRITLSKQANFIKHNAIICLDEEKESSVDHPFTTLTFMGVLDKKEQTKFSTLTPLELKEALIKHYLVFFCENRTRLPKITIQQTIEGEVQTIETIGEEDIPKPHRDRTLKVPYSQLEGMDIYRVKATEKFNLKAFLIPSAQLNANAIYLVSKGELAMTISLKCLLPLDSIKGKRYLFLLSSDYLSQRDNDVRGDLKIHTKQEMMKNVEHSLFSEKEILLEDIETQVNRAIMSLYKEIADKNKGKENNIQALENLFLIPSAIIESIKPSIKIGENDASILRKVYKIEADNKALQDASMKKKIDQLQALDPENENHKQALRKGIHEVVSEFLPSQKLILSQDVTRHLRVLDLLYPFLQSDKVQISPEDVALIAQEKTQSTRLKETLDHLS